VKYLALDLPTLLESIKQIVKVKNNRIYIIMRTPSGGLTILREQLPFLPKTKAMLLSDNKRLLPTLPYNHWKEKEIATDWVVSGERIFKITVEK
jgi:glutamate racemase